MGIAAGTGVGLLHTYWLATDLTDDQINWSKSLIAGIPSTIVSTYVGTKNIRMDHKTDHEG